MRTFTELRNKATAELPPIGEVFEFRCKLGLVPKPLGGSIVDTSPHRLLTRELVRVVDHGAYIYTDPTMDEDFPERYHRIPSRNQCRGRLEVCAIVEQVEYAEWYAKPTIIDGVLTFMPDTPEWVEETYAGGTSDYSFAWFYANGRRPDKYGRGGGQSC